ncbi:MAG: vWA domain-containing protein, partial [Anaerolineae bacterium]|jgi:hypothetical protein
MKSSHSLPSTKYHILLRIGIALTVVGGLLVLLAPHVPASASGPALQGTTEICGGDCVEEEITFETGDLRIDRVDVVFLVDASGSMGDEIDQVQDQSMEIMDSVRALVPDSAFGVASFVDYSEFEDSKYGALYGSGDDYPYRLDQDITEDTGAIRSALNRIELLYGNDTPEAYSRALWEMQFLEWRKDSKRIVILFGDAFPHDRTFFGSDYGTDPGRDEIQDNEDDLVFVDVVQDLVDEKISVIGVNSGTATDAVKFFEYVTDETGGLYFPLYDAGDIPEAVAQSVEEEVSIIDLLTVRVSDEYKDWVIYTPESYTEVGSFETVEFTVRICPLDVNAADGKYDIDLILDADGVILETVSVSIDYEKRCTSGPEVFIGDNDDDDGTVCSEGPFWISNDIVNRLKDDFVSDGEGVSPHQNPLRGEPNYLYTRVHNIGNEDADRVKVTLYWANAGIGLRWPDDWEEIDSVKIDVPEGEAVWTPGIAWDPPGRAGDEHLCILAIIESDDDPVTREGDVSCDNNLAQRNLHVFDLKPGEEDGGIDQVTFDVIAPPEDKMGVIDIVVIVPDAPPGTNVEIIMPGDLFDLWENGGGEVEGGRVKGDRILVDPDERETIIHNVPLEPGEDAEFELEIESPIDDETEPFSVTVVERVDGRDWGGNTYYYAPPPPPSFPASLEDLTKLLQENMIIVGIVLGCCGLSAIGVAVVAIAVMASRRR